MLVMQAVGCALCLAGYAKQPVGAHDMLTSAALLCWQRRCAGLAVQPACISSTGGWRLHVDACLTCHSCAGVTLFIFDSESDDQIKQVPG